MKLFIVEPQQFGMSFWKVMRETGRPGHNYAFEIGMFFSHMATNKKKLYLIQKNPDKNNILKEFFIKEWF